MAITSNTTTATVKIAYQRLRMCSLSSSAKITQVLSCMLSDAPRTPHLLDEDVAQRRQHAFEPVYRDTRFHVGLQDLLRSAAIVEAIFARAVEAALWRVRP